MTAKLKKLANDLMLISQTYGDIPVNVKVILRPKAGKIQIRYLDIAGLTVVYQGKLSIETEELKRAGPNF